jgi:DNA modification methylase
VPCGCGAATRPGLVLDPFMGSGTVALVAREHGRDWLGIELNPEYVQLTRDRLERSA